VKQYLSALLKGDFRTLSRCITAVENNMPGYEELLEQLPGTGKNARRITGVTGPPGAGKSTIIEALINELLAQQRRIAVLAIDPSSPFHHGALLGDRLRMSRHFHHPDVFIRSLATRGALGGLHPKIIEISDLVRAAGFDDILIETVGVGQSEVEIAGLADTTVVVLVPESGDEIQTMKAGLMEIADIFVVNKSDHQQAGDFIKSLHHLVHQKRNNGWQIPIIKTVATEGSGIPELAQKIKQHHQFIHLNIERKAILLTNKAWQLILSKRMQNIDHEDMRKAIEKGLGKGDYNLYRFVKEKI
jgi:LAO/AO transport system kinase